MANNSVKMTNAKVNKADEFYTTYEDIEKEMIFYKNQFKNKIIYCNCDDYTKSNFVKYFQDNFNELGLKELIATSYNPNSDSEYYAYPENRGTYYLYNDQETIISNTNGNGDFRAADCLELLRKSDIVITNPPFSLFREYIELVMLYNKKIIILGNVNGVTCKQVWPYFQEQKLWFGPSISSGDRKFYVPDEYPLEAAGCGIDEDGRRYIKVKGVRWFTNMKSDLDKPFLELTQKYTPEQYPLYDNYNAIEVSKTKDIPMDYDGVMGVPITFLDKHCPEQFEIIGITSSFDKNAKIENLRTNPKHRNRSMINGKELYARILIKRKNK